MKKNILVFGGIAGLILAAFIFSISLLQSKAGSYLDNEIVGYAAMIIAFSFIYIGIRNFREKYNGGVISFGKGLRIGIGIALIGSTVYVGAWLIEYYVFIPDFADKYAAHLLSQARSSNLSAAALDKRVAEINQFKAMYSNPLYVVLMTYLEVLPVGIAIALLAAAILRRQRRRPAAAAIQL